MIPPSKQFWTFSAQLDKVGSKCVHRLKAEVDSIPRALPWFMPPITFVCFLLWVHLFFSCSPKRRGNKHKWQSVTQLCHLCQAISVTVTAFQKAFRSHLPHPPNPCKLPFSSKLEPHGRGWLSLPRKFYIMHVWGTSPSWGWREKGSYALWHGHSFGVWRSHQGHEKANLKNPRQFILVALSQQGGGSFCWAHSAISWPPANNGLDSKSGRRFQSAR